MDETKDIWLSTDLIGNLLHMDIGFRKAPERLINPSEIDSDYLIKPSHYVFAVYRTLNDRRSDISVHENDYGRKLQEKLRNNKQLINAVRSKNLRFYKDGKDTEINTINHATKNWNFW